ncbi:MAG TPA: hypothetical protein VFK02_04565 [Kofleriaceae bacterium]|nr:hypothetical protein [Kofleriaceae bacterium]
MTTARAKGATEALADALLLVLKQRKLVVTPIHERRITGCHDAAKLRRWLARAISVDTVGELLTRR